MAMGWFSSAIIAGKQVEGIMMGWMHPDAEDFLKGRKLDVELCRSLGIRSGTREDRFLGHLPGNEADWILFPNYRGNVEIGTKVRNIDRKEFSQRKGSQSRLYTANTNILNRIEEMNEPLILVEGDLDYVSVFQCVSECVASAPSASTRKTLEDGPPKWIEEEYDLLIKARRIIIAVDCDAAGSKLKENLIEYLDRFRLYEVVFPDGCKDANDVLMKYGAEKLKEVILSAQPVRVSGVRTFSEIQNDADPEYWRTGWRDLDEKVRLTPGLVVLTGYSGAGKSQFLRQLVANLLASGMAGVVGFFENDQKQTGNAISKTLTMLEGHGPKIRPAEAQAMMDGQLIFLDRRQARGGGRKMTTEFIIDVGEAMVLKKNIRFMVIDTWSRVSRNTDSRRVEAEQINEELQLLQDFGLDFGVCVILCAHPTKPKSEQIYPPTEYDIAGSRSFNDNADLVWILHRVDKTSEFTYFKSAKVRDQHLGGKLGWLEFSFDAEKREYSGGTPVPEPDWKEASRAMKERRQ